MAAIVTGGIDLASGKLLVGGSDGKVSAVTPSGDVTITNTGVTAIGANKVTAAMLGSNLGKGYVPLPINTLRIIAANAIGNTSEGMLLDGNTDPSYQRVNGATDKALRAIWAANSVIECQFSEFAYPPDLDDTAAITLNFIAALSGATDTCTTAISFWENTGDTNAGGNIAVTGTALTKYSVTVAAGDVGAYPKFGSVGIIPGAHANDALHLYAAWVEYTRKT